MFSEARYPKQRPSNRKDRAHRMIRGILHDKGCSGRSCRGPRTFLLRVLAPGFAPFRAIRRDFRPKLVTECLFSYEFDGRLQRSWISPAHRRFGRHRNRLFKPNIGSNRTIFPISCDPPNFGESEQGEVLVSPLPRTRVNKARRKGRGQNLRPLVEKRGAALVALGRPWGAHLGHLAPLGGG